MDGVDQVDMTEFAINASVSETTKYAPFKLNGGYMLSMIQEVRPSSAIPKGIKDFAEQALSNLAEAHNAIIEACIFNMPTANKSYWEDPKIRVGNLVYLATKNLNLPKGRAAKLCPKFIGPYRVLEAHPESSTYKLELPTALQECRIHPMFHVSLLRPYNANNDVLFPQRLQPEPYDFSFTDKQEWFINKITGHRWKGKKIEFEVRWSLGDSTWEPSQHCEELAALKHYLELQGAEHPANLPRKKPSQSKAQT